MAKTEITDTAIEKRELLTSEIKEILDGIEKSWRVVGDKLIDLEGTFEKKQGGTTYTKWCKEHFGKSDSSLQKYKKCRRLEVHAHARVLPINDWSVIYQIATKPEPEQEEILQRIEKEDWRPTRKDIREQYPKVKSAKPKQQKPFTREQEKSMEEEIQRRVSERVTERLSTVRKIEQRTKRLARTLHSPMTPTQFKKVVACLHTDTAKRRTEKQLNEAYDIIMKLKPLVEK